MKKNTAITYLFQFTFIIVLILNSSVCYAQKIENVRPEVTGEKINIYYDLNGIAEDQTVFVKAYISTDGGKTYGEPLKSVTGDVGMVVGAGKARCIIWDVFKDMDELVSLNVKFKVTADPVKAEQTFQPLNRLYKLDLNTNLGSKKYLDSKSFGFNLKGTVYLKQLGLGVRGEYFRTFNGKYADPDFKWYYWGYTGGAIIEYDFIKNSKYSLYPFVLVGMSKIIFQLQEPEREMKYYTYSIYGSLGLGFDINVIKFLYLGAEIEYYLSPWIDIVPSEEPDEGLDGLSIGLVIKFVINAD